MGTRRVGRIAGATVLVVLLAGMAAGCGSNHGSSAGPGPSDDTSLTAPERSGSDASPALLAAVCAGTATVSDRGTVTAAAIDEASGIAASRREPGRVVGAQRQRRLGPVLRHLRHGSAAGHRRRRRRHRHRLGGHRRRSAGDRRRGRDAVPGRHRRQRADRARASPCTAWPSRRSTPTPPPPPPTHVTADALTFTYPDGAHDAEALMVDPVSGDLVIVTKDWTLTGHSQVFRAPGDLAAGSTTVLEQVARLDLPFGTLVTGADVSADGRVVALRVLRLGDRCTPGPTARTSGARSPSRRAPDRPRSRSRARPSASPPTAPPTPRSARARSRPSTSPTPDPPLTRARPPPFRSLWSSRRMSCRTSQSSLRWGRGVSR